MFSFEVTAGTRTFKAKLRRNLGQFEKSFTLSVGRFQVKTKILSVGCPYIMA